MKKEDSIYPLRGRFRLDFDVAVLGQQNTLSSTDVKKHPVRKIWNPLF